MRHGNARVAQNGRIGQVALHARYGQFGRKELAHGVGHAEIALGILEIDGVHLVRHGARSDLARLHLLAEILHRYIRPHVARQIDQHRIDTLQGVERGGQIVVMLDLRGILRARKSERVVHERISESHPIDLGIGHVVSVESARGASELGGGGYGVQLGDLFLQTLDEYAELLAQTRRRGGLSVRMRQHRHVAPLVGHLAQLGDDSLQRGLVDIRESLFEQQRRGSVVDILRSEAEVHELAETAQTQRLQFLFQQILHSFHVVVGDALDLLHMLGIAHRELDVELAQLGERRLGHLAQLGQRQTAQSDEILYAHAIAYERILRKIFGQDRRDSVVSAVHGRNG